MDTDDRRRHSTQEDHTPRPPHGTHSTTVSATDTSQQHTTSSSMTARHRQPSIFHENKNTKRLRYCWGTAAHYTGG